QAARLPTVWRSLAQPAAELAGEWDRCPQLIDERWKVLHRLVGLTYERRRQPAVGKIDQRQQRIRQQDGRHGHYDDAANPKQQPAQASQYACSQHNRGQHHQGAGPIEAHAGGARRNMQTTPGDLPKAMPRDALRREQGYFWVDITMRCSSSCSWFSSGWAATNRTSVRRNELVSTPRRCSSPARCEPGS